MKKIILLLLVSSSVWAQQSSRKYSIDDFTLIEKIEDQEKKYTELIKAPAAKLAPTAINDFNAELAYLWLAKGNVERYSYYHAKKPKYSYKQALYLGYALEKLFDEKKDYTNAEKISAALLKELKGTPAEDGIRFSVLYEINAAANARLGNIELAKKMMAKSAADKSSENRSIKYFKDMKSNYLNRQAIVQLAAGEPQKAFDLLKVAFKDAESNAYMIDTFKEAFKKVKGTENGFEEELKSLKNEAYQKYYKEVEKSYIDSAKQTLDGTFPDSQDRTRKLISFRATKPLSQVKMIDLDGKKIDLSDQQGKIVVLDFWTTLCTPCVAAFAGFEKVVEDYKKDEFQLYVVNVFEEGQTVKAFAVQKPIKMQVLRDQENNMYDVRATPTKIVFDAKGNIRFFASGYAGSTDREYYKLKAMVEIIKARS